MVTKGEGMLGQSKCYTVSWFIAVAKKFFRFEQSKLCQTL